MRAAESVGWRRSPGEIRPGSACAPDRRASGIGIVALANGNGTPLPALMTVHAAEMLLDTERKDWNAQALARHKQGEEADTEAEKKKTATRVTGTKPSHKLEEYAADYEAPGYGRLRVEKTGPSLAVVYNGIATPLEHWHYDVFNGLRGDARTSSLVPRPSYPQMFTADSEPSIGASV